MIDAGKHKDFAETWASDLETPGVFDTSTNRVVLNLFDFASNNWDDLKTHAYVSALNQR